MNDQISITKLEEKLQSLRRKLANLETVEAENIRLKRIAADMGDDYRENEAAKLVMEEHNLLHLRTFTLKKEMLETKKQLWTLKKQLFDKGVHMPGAGAFEKDAVVRVKKTRERIK